MATDATTADIIEQRPMMPVAKLILLGLVGCAIGIISIALYYVLYSYMFTPLLCGVQTSARCTNAPSLASGVSLVIAMLGMLVVLVQQRTYRPLLIVLLASCALWNCVLLVVAYPWPVAGVVMAISYGLTLALFSWVSQLRNFYVSLLIGVVAVIVFRIVISA